MSFIPHSITDLLHAQVDPLQKLILMDYVQRKQTGAPILPLRELAVLLNVKPHTIERAIAEMETLGLVLAARGRGKRTVYMAAYPAIPPLHARRSEFEAEFRKQYQFDTTPAEKQDEKGTAFGKQDEIDTPLAEKQDLFDTAFQAQASESPLAPPFPPAPPISPPTPSEEVDSDSVLPNGRKLKNMPKTRVSGQKPPHPLWEEFLALYPPRNGDREVAKGRDRFSELAKGGQDMQAVLEGVKGYRAWADAEGRSGTAFVKQIPTWLNNRVWEEFLPSEEPLPAPPPIFQPFPDPQRRSACRGTLTRFLVEQDETEYRQEVAAYREHLLDRGFGPDGIAAELAEVEQEAARSAALQRKLPARQAALLARSGARP